MLVITIIVSATTGVVNALRTLSQGLRASGKRIEVEGDGGSGRLAVVAEADRDPLDARPVQEADRGVPVRRVPGAAPAPWVRGRCGSSWHPPPTPHLCADATGFQFKEELGEVALFERVLG
jgi:hypothetical protein